MSAVPNRPLRVLFLAHSFPRHSGDAAGNFLLRLARALAGQDVIVEAVAPHDDDLASNETIDGITVHRFRYAPRKYETLAYTGEMAQKVKDSWGAKLTLLSFLGADFVGAVGARRRFEPDVVHAHWSLPGGLVGTWVSSLADIPLVTTLHGTDVRIAKAAAPVRAMFRHVIQKSAVVTTVSRFLADEVQHLTAAPRPLVAPMPVATDLFTPGADGDREERRLLFVGRLTAQKGVDQLLTALAAMQRKASLDVIGDGPEGAALRRQAEQLGIADRVRWIGAQPQPQLVEHYRRAAALVVPSVDEGLGLVAVEAMLCETPVVAFDSGGLRDVVQHDRTGLLVPARAPRALATALDSLLADPERGAELGAAGRLYALGTFAPESVARRYADVYRIALDAPRAA